MRTSTEALHTILAQIEEAIGTLEILREQQEQRGPISSASLERLLTERETVTKAITQIEKLAHALHSDEQRLQSAGAEGPGFTPKCTPVWRSRS